MCGCRAAALDAAPATESACGRSRVDRGDRLTTYRRIRRVLLDEGWHVSVKRVYRIWRREGLKVPNKQPKRGRLWLNDGSCIRSCGRHASSMTAGTAQSRVVL